jgi:hypothetical protein
MIMKRVLIGIQASKLIRQFNRWSQVEWIHIIGLWLCAALVIFSAGFVGANYLSAWRGWGGGLCCTLDGQVDPRQWEGLLARWDSSYYMQIARYGYTRTGDERGFFPLYPFLIGWLSQYSSVNVLWIGLGLSAFAQLASCLIWYHLVKTHYTQPVAYWSVCALLFFPTAFYFFAFYAESLMQCLSLLSIWAMRQGHFIRSGFCIALASVTRPIGWLLLIPYVVEFAQQRRFTSSRCIAAGVGGMTGIAGSLFALNYWIPFERQTYWGAGYIELTATRWLAQFSWLGSTFYDAFMAAAWGVNINPDWFSRAISIFNFVFGVWLLIANIWLARRVPLSWAAFMLGASIFFLSMHGPLGYAWDALPRHVLFVYPVFLFPVLLVHTKPRRYRYGWFALSIISLVLLTIWFASGRWVA